MNNQEKNKITVEITYSPEPRKIQSHIIQINSEDTIENAINQSGIKKQNPEITDLIKKGYIGIWGKKIDPNQKPKNKDRIEIYRALITDPKTARRERWNKKTK